jgi:hypothetical protein
VPSGTVVVSVTVQQPLDDSESAASPPEQAAAASRKLESRAEEKRMIQSRLVFQNLGPPYTSLWVVLP